LADPPADLPLDLEYPEGFFVRGAVVDRTLYWTSIQYLKDVNKLGGGGGGGGGVGFYQLNLSGTPVPFPTAIVPQHKYSRAEIASFLRYTIQPGDTLEQIAQTYNVPVEDLMTVNYLTDSTLYPDSQITIPGVPGPTRLDGERGIVDFRVYVKPDGRQRTQYGFAGEKDPTTDIELTGDNLEALQKVAKRPVKVWGSLSFNEAGTTFLHLEKFEILYPDLQFQILKGTQETKEIDGNQVSLFTTGGTTYVELALSGAYPNANYLDVTGDATIEALHVPDETSAGYPALRVYIVQNQINPSTGKLYELAPIADLYDPLPDPFGYADSFAPLDITIEKVELVYQADDTWDLDAESGSAPRKHYVQPAWHFVGHTSDGAGIDFLIQALDQQYLLPEAQP
ncbi:MAG TPA: LysM peptidoglycan-binding domain-containing protein, partial [Anaerolineales bacterium]|nr:LysM peptidoglycan-binding domain-containing protein [Anaerolineales bacterium]